MDGMAKYKMASWSSHCVGCSHMKVPARFGHSVVLYRCDNRKNCKLIRYTEEDEERTRKEQEEWDAHI
jgi:hypothetical protein